MENLSIGKVVLATFPCSDLTGAKVRPCFVLGIADFDDIVLCQIISRPYHSKNVVELSKSDFANGSIVIDSFIRIDKIVTLDTSRITQILGEVSSSKLKEVKLAMKDFFELG